MVIFSGIWHNEIKLEIDPNKTVKEVKYEYANLIKINKKDIYFIFNGLVMDNHNLMKYYEIENMDTIFVCRKAAG